MNGTPEMMGYTKVYDYTQYAHDNNVNVIPEEAFQRLISDTFRTITDTLRSTYGPYGSSVIISDQSETTTTKDGFNAFQAMGFNHAYKRMVYLAIKKIIERVNRNVGDGTTSCILLAEKIFNNVKDIIKTPDDKRELLKVFSSIERSLQDKTYIESDLKNHRVQPLTKDALISIIQLASNYDQELTDVIFKALDPITNKSDEVVSIRNVITDSDVSLDAESNAMYSFEFMPGDYRVRVNIGVEDANALATPTEIRCVIYDHAFNSTDWTNFVKNWDSKPTLILARTFTRGFMGNEWMTHLRQLEFAKKCGKGNGVNNIYLAEVKGTYIQHEIQDIAHILGTDARDIHNGVIENHDELPNVKVQIFKGNCLAFHDMTREFSGPYIKYLEAELAADTTHSYIKEKEYRDRIKAIKMDTADSNLTVKCGSTLEAELIKDKIDDCISIANSALCSGVVPNLLRYAHDRIMEAERGNVLSDSEIEVRSSIGKAIEGLFDDIWVSKFSDTKRDECEQEKKLHYTNEAYSSFDIVECKHDTRWAYPTSAQYDLEVVVAALSIVKYLLTGRALIFDAHILPAVNDEGHYAQQY